MKSPMVSDLAAGQNIQGTFLVQLKDVRQKKTGDPYLSLVLMDNSGAIDAKMWDNVSAVMDSFETDDFLRVKGETQLYQGRLQITIYSLQRVPDSEVALADFLPASKRDPEEMMAEVLALVSAMKNPHLRALMEAIFADPEIASRYKLAPAAKGIHHAWLGGLIEHVLSLCALARFMAVHYPGLDEDLLLTGVLLHDIGKITELNYTRSFSYSTEGGLLGHMQIGLRIIAEKLPAGFPPKLRNLVEHLVLSHHGQLEFGSPKLPVFPEALMLHHLDNLDSKMATMAAWLEKDRPAANEWTGYNAALERSFLDKQKYLSGKPKAEVKAPSPAAAKAVKQASGFGQAMLAAIDGTKE
ncbi:MAG TPA: HD domain-containing protein [Paludibaculum sp.]